MNHPSSLRVPLAACPPVLKPRNRIDGQDDNTTLRPSTRTILLALVLAVLLQAAPVFAQGAPDEADPLAAYAVLFQRNIFDPNRAPGHSPEAPVYDEAPIFEVPEDWLRLAGVLLDGERAIAFFEGSSPDYDAVVFLDEYLEELLLIAIGTDAVIFYYEDAEVALPVGQGLRRDEDGNWHISEATQDNPVGEFLDSGEEESAEAGESDEGMDMLEKLRMRRNEELGNE